MAGLCVRLLLERKPDYERGDSGPEHFGRCSCTLHARGMKNVHGGGRGDGNTMAGRVATSTKRDERDGRGHRWARTDMWRLGLAKVRPNGTIAVP